MVGASNGATKICELLLKCLADPTLHDSWGHTAAAEAKSNRHEFVYELLTEASVEWEKKLQENLEEWWNAIEEGSSEDRSEGGQSQEVEQNGEITGQRSH